MGNFQMIDLDFRLLMIFQTLFRTRKVSEVGTKLGISQPTVSRGLARLRSHFGDPLFVRTHQGMEPTPCANEISSIVDEMLDIYHARLSQQYQFDPAKSKRKFSIATSEIGHLLLLPRLVNKLSVEAPKVHFVAVPPRLNSLIEELETGETDIAFGSYPKLYAGVYERTVAQENYVCVARAGHPKIRDSLTLEEYLNAQHIIISAKGMGHIHEQIAKQLFEVCPKENIRIINHNFMTTILLAEQTDLIVTLPSRVVTTLGKHLNIKTFKPPIEIPSFEIKIYWHERFHNEPANQWLRNIIGSFFRQGIEIPVR